MYNRSKRHKKNTFTWVKSVLALLMVGLLAFLGVKGLTANHSSSASLAEKQQVEQSSFEKQSSVKSSSSKKDETKKSDKAKAASSSSTAQTDDLSQSEETTTSTELAQATSVEVTDSQVAVGTEETYDGGEIVSADQYSQEANYYVAEASSYVGGYGAAETAYYDNSYYANTAYSSYPTVLSNGNTAGAVGSAAAAQIAAMTGTDAATWEYIIARESNGDPNAYNPSGASGLFQTMPGWGSTATVEDQINSAVNAYNNQGFAAWGF